MREHPIISILTFLGRMILSFAWLSIATIDANAQWTAIQRPSNYVNCLHSVGTNGLLMGSSEYWDAGGLFRSTDNGDTFYHTTDHGATWYLYGPTYYGPKLSVSQIAQWRNLVIAHEEEPGNPLWLLSNVGKAPWTSIRTEGVNPLPENAGICFYNNSLIVGIDGGTAFYRSGDYGRTWVSVCPDTLAPGRSASCTALTNDGTTLYGIAQLSPDPDFDLFRSTNFGSEWSRSPRQSWFSKVTKMTFVSNYLVAGTGEGSIYRSTDAGEGWTQVCPDEGRAVLSFAYYQGYLFVGYSGSKKSIGRIHLATSKMDYVPFPVEEQSAMVVHNDLLFVGTPATYGGGDPSLYRCPVGLLISDVPMTPPTLPVLFSLQQNYPNPFNPSTTIRYGVPQRSHVTLSVCNTLGQHVAALVNGEKGVGYHEVKFDGKDLASGVYLYRMQAGSYVETKKLLLVR